MIIFESLFLINLKNNSMMKTNFLKSFSLILFLCLGLSAWGQTDIFNYDGGGVAPTDWTFVNNISTNEIDRGSYWLVEAGNPSDQIITASYDLSNYSNVNFSIRVATFGSGGNNPAKIEISYDGGSTYTQTATTSTPTNSSYIDGESITLNSVSSQVKIRISNNGTSGK